MILMKHGAACVASQTLFLLQRERERENEREGKSGSEYGGRSEHINARAVNALRERKEPERTPFKYYSRSSTNLQVLCKE